MHVKTHKPGAKVRHFSELETIFLQKNSLKDCWWKVTKTSLNCINQFLGEEDIDYSSEEIIIDEPSKTIPLVNAKKQLIFEKKKDKVNLRFVEI